MARRAFNSYLLQIGIGTHPKFARLTDAEFRAHVAGILAIAAMSPVRGSLLLGEIPAEAVDIAVIAGVPERVVKAAMVKLQAVGVLERDEEHDCLRVHDWNDINPAPRNDASNAERQARHRARNALRNGKITQPVTADVTACNTDEVEVEVKERANALSRPASGPDLKQRERDKASDDDRRLCRLLAERVRERNPKAKISSDVAWLTPMRLMREQDGHSVEEIERLIRWAFTDPSKDASFWAGTIQSTSGLRENFPKAWDRMLHPPVSNGRAVVAVESAAAYLARRGAA